MVKYQKSYFWVLTLLLTIFLFGCPKPKPKIEPKPEPPQVISSTVTVPTEGDIIKTEVIPDEKPIIEEPIIRGTTSWETVPELKTVYFDYDKSDLSRESQEIMVKNADELKKYPKKQVLVEGHCCECGTIEYNIGLGQRRAKIVRDYYIQLGIDPKQIATISYGKEKPVYPGVCPPDNLEFGGKNRRVETKLGK